LNYFSWFSSVCCISLYSVFYAHLGVMKKERFRGVLFLLYSSKFVLLDKLLQN